MAKAGRTRECVYFLALVLTTRSHGCVRVFLKLSVLIRGSQARRDRDPDCATDRRTVSPGPPGGGRAASEELEA